MPEPDVSRFSMRPRTVLLLLVAIAVIAAAAVWLSLQLQPPGRVRLLDLSADTTATVGLAGVFPGEGDDPLANPLGVAWDGGTLYVAESDAGRVALFDEFGGRIGVIGIPLAAGAATAYPSSVAVGGDTIAVVDNAASRVIVVATSPAETADALFVLGGDGLAPGQPTSVLYAEGEYYVTDGADGTVKVYDDAGTHLRTLGADLQPRLAHAGGLTLRDGLLYVADSNGGRVVALNPASGALEVVFPDRYALPRAIVPIGEDRLAVLDTLGRSVYLTTGIGVHGDVIDAETVPDGVPESPRGMAWVSGGSRLYVTDAAAGRVFVFNVRGE